MVSRLAPDRTPAALVIMGATVVTATEAAATMRAALNFDFII